MLHHADRTYIPMLSQTISASPLVRFTKSDRSLIEQPILLPYFETRTIGPESILLVSEISSRVLHGGVYVSLLPLLDGKRTRREIVDHLSHGHSAIAVQSALALLATKGIIVSADFSIPNEVAAYWAALGASPTWVEERLALSSVVVVGHNPLLVSYLERLGVMIAPENRGDPTLLVVVTDDYLASEHAETNARALRSNSPWVLIRSNGSVALFGPVFGQGPERPCWACLGHRLRANLEVENFLRYVDGDDGGVRTYPNLPPVTDAILALSAAEITKWIVLGELAVLDAHAISFDTLRGEMEKHAVMRRPQCQVCGDENLYRNDRAPVAPRFGTSPKSVRNSGGFRSVTPEETLSRYRHLVSPVSGVVTQLARVTEDIDPFLHVYFAGSNLALKADNLMLLRNSLRTKSSGKGSTPKQAEASALCEALERYSGVFHGDEIRRRARYCDFPKGVAIHPNDVQLYSDRQYESAEEFNARGSRFNYVPAKFAEDVELDWSPVWSVTSGCHRYLPTSMLYYAMPLESGVLYCGPDSNGCAAGNTLEEAVLQGFFELVERDAFACWWYNRISVPELDLSSFDDPFIGEAKGYYAAISRELWLLDITHDFGIPVFVAISRRVDKDAEDILFSAGAHFDPQIAALRALCELNQYLGAVRDTGSDGDGYLYDDPELMWWWLNATLDEHPYLGPDRSAKVRTKATYSPPGTDDVLEDVELCRSLVEGLGMEFLVLDQTRSDVGIPVAKTIVPGMRHFWARFGPGRLYNVPVSQGWLTMANREIDLNPIAVFI